MSDATHASFTFSDFPLTGGGNLPEVTLAYVTRGRLAPDGRNAILVTHGYTSGQGMIEAGVGSSEGAWPRGADRHRSVLCRLLQHVGVELWIDQRRLD